MINKKRQRDNSISNLEENSSSGSEKFIISSSDKKNSFQICKIKSRKALSDKLKKLKNPFIILDKEIISNFNSKIKEKKEGESFEQIIDFNKIDKEKIVFLDNETKISKFYSNKKETENNIIFSNLNNNNENNENNEADIEKEIFIKLIKFKNRIENECKISDFCVEYNNIFENNSIDKFYKSIRKPRSYPFRLHLYTKTRIIMKLFGPRKTSKSIYLRCVLANYHFKYSEFRPTLIFDIAFISKNIKFYPTKFQKVFYYELFSLFKDIYDVDEFYNTINFKIVEAMEFVDHVINSYFEYIKSNNLVFVKPLFCIDNYSLYYDKEKIIEKIEKESKFSKKYNLYIIYSIITKEDQAEYVKNIDNICELVFPETEFPCFYLSSFRNIPEFGNSLENENLEIPNAYKELFGENAFYLFKYLKEGINFEDFVKKEEIEIRKELEIFYGDASNRKMYMNKLIDAIKNKSLIDYDHDFLLNIPSNYIIINKVKNKFSFEYCFPLIKKIFGNLLKQTYINDINTEEFLGLPDTLQSMKFDRFGNEYFEKENSYFGYKEEEIEKAKDDYCLENNSFIEKNQIYKFNDVISLIEKNKFKNENLLNLINKYKGKDLLKNKKLIVVFQQFRGKFVDILFLVKKENNAEYSIVNLQMKLSKTFKITKEDKKLEPFQMTYLQQKYQYIFGINIVDSYVMYASIFEMQRKFAEENQDICIFYSRKKRTFVDNKGNIYNKFPFLDNAKIELISKLNILINSFQNTIQVINQKKLKFIKVSKEIDKNTMKIIISKEKIEIKVKFMEMENIYIQPNDSNFEVKNIYYKIMIDDY